MGTRSTIKFYDRYYRNLLSIYNQYDGYLEGIGAELVEFFESEQSRGNGFSDVALLYVIYKKSGAYHTYATTENDIQEYNYIIQETDEGLRFTVKYQDFIDGQEVLRTIIDWVDYKTFKDIIEKKLEKIK